MYTGHLLHNFTCSSPASLPSLPSLTFLYIVGNTNRTAAADAGGATPSASSSPCARVPARLGLPDGRSALLQLSV